MRIKPVIAIAALTPSLVADSEPVRLQPSSPWDVDYAENSCRLVRKFGAGNSETLLIFESEGPDALDMVVVGKPLAHDGDEVPARFVPVQVSPFKGLSVTSTDKGRQPGILFGNIQLLPEEARAKLAARAKERSAHPNDRPPPRDLAEERERKAQRQEFAAKATEIEIDTRRGHPVFLETGSMGEAIKAFDQCTVKSLKDWGIDPTLEDKIVRPVWLQNRGNVITWRDYPSKMLDQGQQSEVKTRVLVDASGRVTKCTPLSYFDLPQFTQLVCDKITRNGKFAPAELADGTKVPSYYTVHINFRIGH
jgi:hypothetical protein